MPIAVLHKKNFQSMVFPTYRNVASFWLLLAGLQIITCDYVKRSPLQATPIPRQRHQRLVGQPQPLQRPPLARPKRLQMHLPLAEASQLRMEASRWRRPKMEASQWRHLGHVPSQTALLGCSLPSQPSQPASYCRTGTPPLC